MVVRSIQPRLASSLWFTSRNWTIARLAASAEANKTNVQSHRWTVTPLCYRQMAVRTMIQLINPPPAIVAGNLVDHFPKLLPHLLPALHKKTKILSKSFAYTPKSSCLLLRPKYNHLFRWWHLRAWVNYWLSPRRPGDQLEKCVTVMLQNQSCSEPENNTSYVQAEARERWRTTIKKSETFNHVCMCVCLCVSWLNIPPVRKPLKVDTSVKALKRRCRLPFHYRSGLVFLSKNTYSMAKKVHK